MHRTGWLMSILMLGAIALTVPAVMAEEPAHNHDHAAAANHDAGHEGGDAGPLSGKTNEILDLAIWTVVVFLILAFLLSKFAWKPMLAALTQREANIRGALEEAERARDEAQSIRLSLKKQMDDANLQVRAIIEEGKKSAQVVADDLMVKAKADISTERDRLHREIQVATDQALQTLWAHTAELATQVSAKALGRSLDGDGHRRLIDDALKELQAAGTNGHA